MLHPESIETLPVDSLYAYPEHPDRDQSFTVRYRHVHIVARAVELSTDTFAVTVVDDTVGRTTATATIVGTQLRAAQQVAGLLAGTVMTVGGVTEAVRFPSVRELRDMLDAEVHVLDQVEPEPVETESEAEQTLDAMRAEREAEDREVEAICDDGGARTLNDEVARLTGERDRLRRDGRRVMAQRLTDRIDELTAPADA